MFAMSVLEQKGHMFDHFNNFSCGVGFLFPVTGQEDFDNTSDCRNVEADDEAAACGNARTSFALSLICSSNRFLSLEFSIIMCTIVSNIC